MLTICLSATFPAKWTARVCSSWTRSVTTRALQLSCKEQTIEWIRRALELRLLLRALPNPWFQRIRGNQKRWCISRRDHGIREGCDGEHGANEVELEALGHSNQSWGLWVP